MRSHKSKFYKKLCLLYFLQKLMLPYYSTSMCVREVADLKSLKSQKSPVLLCYSKTDYAIGIPTVHFSETCGDTGESTYLYSFLSTY